jgi:hypothetical protein
MENILITGANGMLGSVLKSEIHKAPGKVAFGHSRKITTKLEDSNSVLAPIIHDIKDKINKKNEWGVLYGEFEQSDSSEISLKNVSHCIDNAVIVSEGTDGFESLYADINILNTNKGKLLKSILGDSTNFDEKYLNVSARYIGSVDPAFPNGKVTIQKLLTYDIVPDTPEQVRQKKLESRKRKISSILKE